MHQSPEPWWHRTAINIWLAASSAALIASFVAHLLIGLDTDHIDIMDQVARLASGGEPYIAYADINPPLIHLLYLIPYTLSQHTFLPLSNALWFCIYALAALSLTCCRHLLGNHAPRIRWAIICAIAVPLIIISFLHQAFGDRDHLMLIFITPWLLLNSPLVTPDSTPRRWRHTAAILAAMGIALKPYFLIFYAATCVTQRPFWQQFRQREHHLIWATIACYAGLILLAFPQYLTESLPLSLNTYHDNAWTPTMRIAAAKETLIAGFWPIWLGVALSYIFRRPNRTTTYLLVLTITGLLSYLLNAGWYYTQYPFYAFAFALAFSACAQLLRPGRQAFICLLCAAFLAFRATQLILIPAYDRALLDIAFMREYKRPAAMMLAEPTALAQINARIGDNSHYLFLGTNLRALSFKTANRVSVGRYDHLWPITSLVRLRSEDQATYKNIWPIFIGGITQDILQQKPDHIIVDVSPQQMPLQDDFNIMAFLMTEPSFAQAMQAYAAPVRISTCPGSAATCAFDIYSLK